MSKPLYANRWYDQPPVRELRQEVQHLYEQFAQHGPTTSRPTGAPVGWTYFDTDLNKPIWYGGTAWVDATGAAA